MPTDNSPVGPRAGATAPGALLLCRAEPASVASAARLLREPMLLTGAGERWSVLVPEGRPWRDAGEPVDRVAGGWAAALAVGAPWPVLALWWDPDRAGFTLAAGFRRPVGYVWLANGVAAGEDEAMRTFAARLGLDPVLDMQSLDRLTRPDDAADGRTRIRGLLAVLTRVGVALPGGLVPGDPAARLVEAAESAPDVRRIDRPGWREAVRTELDVVENGLQDRLLGPFLPWTGGPRARALSLAQIAAGLPLTAWGLHRRSAGRLVAGTLLLAHGTLGLGYGLAHPRD
ncbi:hypothetical protein ACWC10_24045 [Streptomyces sp. NPDC001595]|uniref:hypothetical protein n=1 Tax=Streptomyces sp. NPDC001532 TaxID=3154520 RepID=UPI00332FFCAD